MQTPLRPALLGEKSQSRQDGKLWAQMDVAANVWFLKHLLFVMQEMSPEDF